MSGSDILEHKSQQPLAKNIKLRHDTRSSDSSQEVNYKKRERQQRYREQNREKLKQREAERRKRKQTLKITADPSTSTSSNINIIELNNEELTDRNSQNFSDWRKTQISSVEENEQAEDNNVLQKKKEQQQRYRENNREKLKQREAERRKRKQSLQTTAETPSSSNIDCIENIISEADEETSANSLSTGGLEDPQNTFFGITERLSIQSQVKVKATEVFIRVYVATYSLRVIPNSLVSAWWSERSDVKSTPNAPLAPTLLETGIKESTSSEPIVKPIIQNSWLALNTTSQSPGLQEIPILIHNKDSSSSKAFSPDQNSYFQFFRSIYNDYLELPAKKQRQFKRRCLSFLHELLDDEDNDQPTPAYPHQANVLNLSHSGHVSEDDNDVKPLVEDGHILPDP